MRKLTGYIVSWSLYWLGHLTSCLLNFDSMWWLYPVYNRLMNWSYDIQEWGGNQTPWSKNNT